MSNPWDFDRTTPPPDAGNPWDGDRNPAQARAVVTANDNGDDAARAITVGRKLGVPAPVVETDVAGYEAHQRQQDAGSAANNDFVAKYINQNPMASKVSSDDWPNLLKLSDSINLVNVGGFKLENVLARAVEGAKAGFGEEPIGFSEANRALLPKTFLTWQPFVAPLDAFSRAFPAGFGALAGAAAETIAQISGNDAQGMRLARDIMIFGKGVLADLPQIPRVAPNAALGPIHMSTEEFLAREKGRVARQEIDDFLRTKTDEKTLQITKAEVADEALTKAVDVASETKTKVRSPEMLAEFGAAHGQELVHIPADKILDLYRKEGITPAAGDGLFGFVPGIGRKLMTAEETGAEVSIPVSDYIAHVDPTVHEGLRDVVRLHDDGVTKEEAKEFEPKKDLTVVGPEEGFVRFYHGGDNPTDGGGRWVTTDPEYARNFRTSETTNAVHYVDIPVGDPTEIAARAWDPILDAGTNMVGRYKHIEIPEAWAQKLKPFQTESTTVDTRVQSETTREKQSLFLNNYFTDAKSLNITEAEFAQYSKKIERAQQAVLDRAIAVNAREVAKRITPDWKAKEAAVKAEVTTELTNVGPFAAERYLREQKITALDYEQAEAIAPMFGYADGVSLMNDLTDLATEREGTNVRPQTQLDRAVADEVTARMEERYGDLDTIIAEEARAAALEDHTFDILADEVRYLAKASGTKPPLSRADMEAWAKQTFANSTLAEATDWQKHRRAVERNGREAEKALLKGKFDEALDAKQRQMLAALVAKESNKFHKQADDIAKQFNRITNEEAIASTAQDYLEAARGVLETIGLPQRFGTNGELAALVAQSEGQLAVAPWLFDGTRVPDIKNISVDEFKAVADSVKSLMHVGRWAKKLDSAHRQADLQNTIVDIRQSLERFNFIDQPLNPSMGQRAASLGRYVTGSHLLVERMFDYTDRFDPHGPITEFLDRPLRDSHSREIVMTEEVTRRMRKLREFTDPSVNELIPNQVLPDGRAISGFLKMRRYNLRQLMLNMGSESNIEKVTTGFKVKAEDVWGLIDANATKADWQWVQGVWDIFAYLKPMADAMSVRDTGVPVDTIPAQAIKNAHGDWKGGYYPVVHDRTRGNIIGQLMTKDPLFDNNYPMATTPHGYTVERTGFEGPLDLTGSFLPTKIQGQIHDIAFREAVRNANKLIFNQEFRTEIARRWGNEYAELLPGWLKDIANSHNFDENYAQGVARAMAVVRQNVISTLIAFNPGTVIKHGASAMLMSAQRVGWVPMLKALAEFGPTSMIKTAKDYFVRDDRVPDKAFIESFRDTIDTGPRGESVRRFILESSAVMRNRQRQYDDTIRGAYDQMNNSGWLQSAKNFRQWSMNVQRIAVAMSDSFSAQPMWYAAYKKAYEAGENHRDAVFIADKEVSRAHGSNFVGDQPRVLRIPNGVGGEALRWFTPLMRFWNHQVNNNMQLAWDVKSRLGSDNPEPSANIPDITKRVAQIITLIAIEESAGAALDEDHKGLITRMMMASIRYFGSGFVGVRDITNGLASGYEPSVGLLSTLYKELSKTATDIKNSSTNQAKLSKDALAHAFTALGFATGIGGQPLGKAVQFQRDVITGRERPKNFNEWRQGYRTGHTKARIHQ